MASAILDSSGRRMPLPSEATHIVRCPRVVENNLYKYPDIYLCPRELFGCDREDLERSCTASHNETDGGITEAMFNPRGNSTQEIAVEMTYTETPIFQEDKAWCLKFTSSSIEIGSDERDPEDFILLDMYWYPGGSPGNSTTCLAKGDDWESHSESLIVFLRDADSGTWAAGVRMAYNCVNNASNSHVVNSLGIGITKLNKLSDDNTATYVALSSTSAIYKDKKNEKIEGIINPYAHLSMTIAQQTDSLVTITEINPLEIAEILGQVGGFWVEPHLKLRSFKKTFMNGMKRTMSLTCYSTSSTGQRSRKVICNEQPALDPAIPMPHDLEALEEGRHRRASEEDPQRPSPRFVASSFDARVHDADRAPAAGASPIERFSRALPPASKIAFSADPEFQNPQQRIITKACSCEGSYPPRGQRDLSLARGAQGDLPIKTTPRVARPFNASRSLGSIRPRERTRDPSSSPAPERHLPRAPRARRGASVFPGSTRRANWEPDVDDRVGRRINSNTPRDFPAAMTVTTVSGSETSPAR